MRRTVGGRALVQPPLAFAHPLLSAGIYNEKEVTKGADTHRQAARQLADGHEVAARVAEHLLAATPTSDADPSGARLTHAPSPVEKSGACPGVATVRMRG
jgi:hypothetical protein